MEKRVHFDLTDEQYQAIYEACDEILESPVPVAASLYYVIFKTEPTNSDLKAFHALLNRISWEKSNGIKGNEGFNHLTVIDGGKRW